MSRTKQDKEKNKVKKGYVGALNPEKKTMLGWIGLQSHGIGEEINRSEYRSHTTSRKTGKNGNNIVKA